MQCLNCNSIISNRKLPPILFICIEAINFKILDTIKDTIINIIGVRLIPKDTRKEFNKKMIHRLKGKSTIHNVPLLLESVT